MPRFREPWLIIGATGMLGTDLVNSIRQFGPEVVDRLYFKNCNAVVKRIIGMVVEYMQEGD